MPSVANKALLADVKVSVAENNVRRVVLDIKANLVSTDADVNQKSTVVLPSGSYNYVSILNNSTTIVRCSVPLTAQITTPTGAVTMRVNYLLILTDEVTSILFNNLSTTDIAQLTILQA